MKNFSLKVVLSAVFGIALSVNCHAQDIYSYAQSAEAMEYVGLMAHPMQSVLGTRCISASNDYVDVSIRFKSLARSYWEDYRINIRSKQGIKYFSSVVRTKRVSIYEPFGGLKWTIGLIDGLANHFGYSLNASESETLQVLYGQSSPTELSSNQIAAIKLMAAYAQKFN